MPSLRHNKTSPFVYSTDPDFSFGNEREEVSSLTPSEQLLRVRLDTKQRKGKTVTIVEGFAGKDDERASLGKKLKTALGTGGSVKEEQIIIQGTHLEKVKAILLEWGYRVK